MKNWFVGLGVRNSIALLLIASSLALLYPGVVFPMMEIKIFASLNGWGRIELFNQTQSIAQSIESLYQSGNRLVAFLILLFSICVPVLKAMLLLFALLLRQGRTRQVAHRIVSVIGKWSMADVFVVAIMMAFLAGNATSNAEAQLFSGFYYFTAYCVLSILGTQLMSLRASGTAR